MDRRNNIDAFYVAPYVEEDLDVVTNAIDANTIHVANIALVVVYMLCPSKGFEFTIPIFILYLVPV